MGRGISGRLLGPGGAGGVVAMVVLIALAPSGLGARSHSTLKPAYAGTSSDSFGSTSYNCGSAAAPGATWTPTTGALASSAAASFSTCSYSLFGNESAIGGTEVYVFVPFSVSTASLFNVTTSFSWKAVDKMAISPGTCPAPSSNSFYYNVNNCTYFVEYWTYVETWMYDLTTSSIVSASSNVWEVWNYTQIFNSAYCTFGFCGSGGATYTGSSSSNYIFQDPYFNEFVYFVGPGTHSGKGSLWTNSTNWDPTYMCCGNITLYPGNSYADVIAVETGAWADASGTSDSTYIYGGSTTSYFNPPGAGSASISTSLKFTSISIAVG